MVERAHVWEVQTESRAAMTDEDVMELRKRAYAEANVGFSLFLEVNRRIETMDSEGKRRAEMPKVLADFEAFLNSEPTLDFFREVTSIRSIRRSDVMSTRFSAGDFLLFHNDDVGSTRVAAFVVNLTRGWKPEWGGLLQFLSPQGRIAETFVPRFNTLHLFRVPQPHGVSYVAPFAQASRYAISGWLYID